MPDFLHYYGGYTHESYKRIPHGIWHDLVEHMYQAAKAA